MELNLDLCSTATQPGWNASPSQGCLPVRCLVVAPLVAYCINIQ